MKQQTGWKRYRRNPEYQTQRWRDLAREVVRGKLCELCAKPARAADHRILAEVRPDLFYERSNLRPLCTSCNARRAAYRSNAVKPYKPPPRRYWVV